MKVKTLHPFDLPPKDAMRLQAWLASKVVAHGRVPAKPRLVGAVDCSVDREGHVHGAVVVCEAPDWKVVEVVSASAPAPMPYIPGLLSFRETPILLDALRRLRARPQLLLVDGQGIAHPRGLGIAAHIGLHVDVPVVGVAKSILCGTHARAGKKRGDWRPLMYEGRRIGVALTTRDGVSPVYVSIGNHIGLLPAARRVLQCATRYRVPEPIRHADSISRRLARGHGVVARA